MGKRRVAHGLFIQLASPIRLDPQLRQGEAWRRKFEGSLSVEKLAYCWALVGTMMALALSRRCAEQRADNVILLASTGQLQNTV